MDNVNCPECYPNQPKFWRDAPMNEEVRKNLTWQQHANLYYFTLDDALDAWGANFNKEDYE